MPRRPSISEPIVERLAFGTRFAPPLALRRAVERAESLVHEIDPDAMYPEDFLVFKLLAYRPETSTTEAAQGRAILAALPGLIDRWSALARFSLDELAEEGGVEAAELAERWRVSRKTLSRWATLGLLPRRARDARGTSRAVYMPEVVTRFRVAHAAELARAAAFSRISDAQSEVIARRAAAYTRKLGWRQTRAAQRLAVRFGRSVEAIRQILARSRDDAGHRPTPDEWTRRVMHRAAHLGMEPAALADRFGCTTAAAQRGINLVRLRLVRTIVQGIAPAGERAHWTRHPALTHAVVCEGLGWPGVTDLAGFFGSSRTRLPPSPREERVLLEAYAALRGIAAGLVSATSPQNPEAQKLDEAETALRWSFRLKAELMRRQLALLVETADAAFGMPIEAIPATRAAQARLDLLHALSSAIDHADPAKAGRIAAPAGLAMAAAAAKLARGAVTARPRALSQIPAGITVPDWTLSTNAGQPRLEPEARVRRHLADVPVPLREVLALRFGLSGSRPMTYIEIAARLGVARVVVPRLERRGVRAAIEAARRHEHSGRRPASP